MATSFLPSYVLFMDYLYDDRKRKLNFRSIMSRDFSPIGTLSDANPFSPSSN